MRSDTFSTSRLSPLLRGPVESAPAPLSEAAVRSTDPFKSLSETHLSFRCPPPPFLLPAETAVRSPFLVFGAALLLNATTEGGETDYFYFFIRLFDFVLMSWSDGRSTSTSSKLSSSRRKEGLAAINSLLEMYAGDHDLHDDLKIPIVNAAFCHWTNQKRLEPQQAAKLMENYRVQSVFGKVQKLQHICKEYANMPFPLDHIVGKRKRLSDELVKQYFGEEFVDKPDEKPKPKVKAKPTPAVGVNDTQIPVDKASTSYSSQDQVADMTRTVIDSKSESLSHYQTHVLIVALLVVALGIFYTQILNAKS